MVYIFIALKIILFLLFLGFIMYNLTSSTTLYNWVKKLYRIYSKTKLKHISIKGKNGEQDIFYLEGNPKAKKTIVLLHGITADKYVWPFFARAFVKKGYRVLAIDLPPFGQSSYDENITYTIDYQAKNLKDILEHLNVTKGFHLMGNSMGGGVAAKFALLYPELLSTLTLIDNLGIYSVKRTEFLDNIESGGRNFLLIKTMKDVEQMLELVYHKQPFIPEKIKQALLKEGRANYDVNKKVFNDIIQEEWYFENELEDLKVPTFILWGKEDIVFDVSSAEFMAKRIKNNQLQIIDHCGHMPMNEQASKSANLFLEFLQSLKENESHIPSSDSSKPLNRSSFV